jgi:hypothetical protein
VSESFRGFPNRSTVCEWYVNDTPVNTVVSAGEATSWNAPPGSTVKVAVSTYPNSGTVMTTSAVPACAPIVTGTDATIDPFVESTHWLELGGRRPPIDGPK